MSENAPESGRAGGIAVWLRVWRSVRGRGVDRGDALPGLLAVTVLSPAMFVAGASLVGATPRGGLVIGTLFALLAWFHVLFARIEGWSAGEGLELGSHPEEQREYVDS